MIPEAPHGSQYELGPRLGEGVGFTGAMDRFLLGQASAMLNVGRERAAGADQVFVTYDSQQMIQVKGADYVMPITSAMHKQGELVISLAESGFDGMGVLLLNRRDARREVAAVSKKEPGPVDPMAAADYKLREAINKFGDEVLGIISVGDLAMVLADIAGSPLVDVTKPGENVNAAKYIADMFKLAGGEGAQLKYGATTGWARRVAGRPGGKPDAYRKLLIHQRMFLDFNQKIVAYFSDETNTQDFTEFWTRKRGEIILRLANLREDLTDPIWGAVLGPALSRCAGALPLEYLLWYVLEEAPASEQLKLTLRLPEQVRIQGVEDTNNIVIASGESANLPMEGILRYVMSHVYNYPEASVVTAMNFFRDYASPSNGYGINVPARRELYPPRR